MRKIKIKFTSRNQQISGTLFVPKVTSPTLLPGVVFYHGRGSSQKGYFPRAEAVAERGIICLTFDFRGCGQSEGDFSRLTIQDGIDDALAGFDFLIGQEGVDSNRVGICGRSFGGFLAALVSEKRKVKLLVLSAPAIYRDSWFNKVYGEVPLKEIKDFRHRGDLEKTSAIRAVKKFKGDLLVIGNEKDEVIPEEVVRAYYDWAVNTTAREITFIKDAGHQLNQPEFNQKFIKLITEWFVRTT